MNEIRAESWGGLMELLYAGSWNETLRRHRAAVAFRGMGRATGDLSTTLVRLGGPSAQLESHIIRNFRKYAHREAVAADSIWHWLAVAQHHGAPTRLLDWTFSPYVALHFATASDEHYGEDGVVWCVDFAKTNQLLPEQLKAMLTKEGSAVFTAEMLLEAAATLESFDALSGEEFVLFFDPPSLDDRIVNQAALFSLMSSATTALDGWLAHRPELYRRITIPAALKWEIRDKLDQANINERVLYPGLDGLSLWLKRYYSPRH
jgi:hypothetical protein